MGGTEMCDGREGYLGYFVSVWMGRVFIRVLWIFLSEDSERF